MPKKKTKKKKIAPKKKSAKPARKQKSAKAKKTPKKKAPKKVRRRSRQELNEAAPMAKGPGPGAGGQAGDLEGLSDVEDVDSESVQELVEEGQDYEAEVVSAVENAPDPDEAEITAEIPEGDDDPDRGSFGKRNRL